MPRTAKPANSAEFAEPKRYIVLAHSLSRAECHCTRGDVVTEEDFSNIDELLKIGAIGDLDKLIEEGKVLA